MRRLILLFTAVLSLGAHAGEARPLAQNPAVEARLVAISEELRCLVCQNESLAASRADLAEDLRREIRAMIAAGRTDAEIRDFLVARYGDFVLYRPPVKTSTWLLWFGPFLLLGGGVIALFAYLRRRAANLGDGDIAALSESEHAEAQALLGEDGEGQ